MPPLSVIRALWKRKTALVLAWVVASGATFVIVRSLPAIYRAETLILVESQRIPEKFVTATVDVDLRDRLSTLSQQILSHGNLLKIIQKFDLYRGQRRGHVEEEIVEMMRQDISIQLEEERKQVRPGAFRVAYKGPDPRVVALVAGQLGNLFIDENLRAREVFALGTSEFLENQLAESKRRLEAQEAQLSQYKLRHNGELPQQENLLIASAARLQVQLQGVQDEISRAQEAKLMFENALASAEASAAAMAQLVEEFGESAAAGMSGKLGEKPSEVVERELAQAQSRYTGQHPEVQKLRETLRVLRELEQKPASARTTEADGNGASKDPSRADTKPTGSRLSQVLIRERERIENLKAQQAATEQRLETREAERQRILREIAAVQQRLQRLPIREQELVSVMRDYEITKANYQALLDKKLAAEMAAEMEKRQKAERFTILDAARIPEKPVKPDRPLLFGLGSGLGLLLGAVFVLGSEIKRNTVLGEWELPRNVPILGRVPVITPQGNGKAESEVTKTRPRGFRRPALVVLLLALLAVAAAGLYVSWRLGWILAQGPDRGPEVAAVTGSAGEPGSGNHA